MALQDLNRAQDTPVATLKLAEITPKNWHKFPPAPLPVAPIYVPVITYQGGAYGDDVTLATANSTDAYAPKTQAEKATMPGGPTSAVQTPPLDPDYVLATDITAPRGYIGPRDPYSKPVPAAPTITSLVPNTAVAGAGPAVSVTINGTGFTQWTTIKTGGVQTPYAQYVSPTKMVMLQDTARSVAGTVQVVASDHSVDSAPANFTFT